MLPTLPQHTREIDGDVYKVSALPARRSRRLLIQLISKFGPALEPAFKDNADARDVIGSVCTQLDPDTFDLVCDTFAAVTVVNDQVLLDQGPRFDLHFAQRFGTMLKWLKFCLETEYASFLDALREAGSLAHSESPTSEKTSNASASLNI